MSLDRLRVLPLLFLFFFVAVAESLFLLLLIVVVVVDSLFITESLFLLRLVVVVAVTLPSSSSFKLPTPRRGSVVVIGLGLLLPQL